MEPEPEPEPRMMTLLPRLQTVSQAWGRKSPVLKAAAFGSAAGVSGGIPPPPPMTIPQGYEGEGTGGAVGGQAITRSMTTPPGGAQFAPEGLGPKGV